MCRTLPYLVVGVGATAAPELKQLREVGRGRVGKQRMHGSDPNPAEHLARAGAG
jgi:hypothetical protein